MCVQDGKGTAKTQGCGLPNSSVRAQLQRILQSPLFSNAPSLGRFLKYLVEHVLEGKAEEVKQYSVGVEVFNRGESFDPRTDTIVRVQARRLRSRLQTYYETVGLDDPIVISVPAGRYYALCESALVPRHGSPTDDVQALTVLPGRTGVAPRRTARRPPPLPAPRTPLIGREQDIAIITQRLLSQQARLLTITGAGGSGKTRLALHVAAELSSHFTGGVYFAPLAGLTDAGMLETTIAQLLGVRHTGGMPLAEALQGYFRTSVQSQTLLLLDNFEHILSAAPLIPKLLDACPALKVFVTSRAVLHVYGEHEYAALPLAVPNPKCLPPLPELSHNPAIELFLQRVAAVSPTFILTPENAHSIAEICSRLDGLPLAIELAAARMKILSPAAMLTRFRSSLDFLAGGASDMPARQQTLRRTIDWSHELLSAAEQKLFRRLSVFSGGCTLEGAEAVCDTRRDLEIDLLEGISSLVDKSMVHELRDKNGVVRFGMLETIREYGIEWLAASGETELTKRAHAAFVLVLAEEGNPQLTPQERSEWLALCEAEHDNLHAAFEWLLATDNANWAFRLGTALFGFWERREYLAEGRERLQAILKLKSAQARTKERARVILYAGTLATNQGDYEAAIRMYQEALQIHSEFGDKRSMIAQLNNMGVNRGFQGDYGSARMWFERSLEACRELGDKPEIAAVLSNLANIVNAQGNSSLARSLLEEAVSIFRQLGDLIGVGWSFSHLGDVARDEGNLIEARRLYREAADIFHTINHKWGIARSFSDLGHLACDQGDAEAAHSAFEEAIKGFQSLGHQRGVAKVLEGFASLAAREGNFERVLMLAGAAATLRHSMGVPPRPGEQAKLDRTLDVAWQSVNRAPAQVAWRAGQQMTLEEAIQYAMRSPESECAKATGS
jgi:predicted ATPase